MLADEPDIGTGSDPREALRAALARRAVRFVIDGIVAVVAD